ncbi:MAG: hypothetical protein ACC645_28040, partial [Pirellulales bacterium]
VSTERGVVCLLSHTTPTGSRSLESANDPHPHCGCVRRGSQADGAGRAKGICLLLRTVATWHEVWYR